MNKKELLLIVAMLSSVVGVNVLHLNMLKASEQMELEPVNVIYDYKSNEQVKVISVTSSITEPVIEEVEEVVVEEDLTYDFCNTIDRWENQRTEVASENFHGVQINGENVYFPTMIGDNYFEDSYQWCYNTVPEMVTDYDIENYVCNVYKSMNTCNNISEFIAEMKGEL